MTPAQVDPSNEATAAAWDGYDGDQWAKWADMYDLSIATYHATLLDAAAVAPTDRVLDIGCGNGQVTRDCARRATDGSAVGIDLSTQMLDVARRRAATDGVNNASFVHGDAQVYPFADASYDLVVSRAGAMFFGDPVAAYTNIGRALRPGGRLALIVWQAIDDNEWVSELRRVVAAGRDLPLPPPDAPGPFSMADPARVEAILTAAGFTGVTLNGQAAPMYFGRDTDESFDFLLSQGFVRFMTRDLDEVTQAGIRDELRATVAAHETDDGVRFTSSAWLVTATRP